MYRLLLVSLVLFNSLAATITQLELSKLEDVSVITLEDGRDVLADAEGFALYTFDVDQASGESRCFGSCLVAWPIFESGKDQLEAPFSIHQRVIESELINQVVLKNEPLYYFISDKVPGVAFGDGAQGVWHVIQVK